VNIFLITLIKKGAWDWIDENKDKIIGISNKIWDYAELGLVEENSAKLLITELEKEGFKIQVGVAGMPTSFIASCGNNKPIIGFLGEYDALPGISNKKIPKKEPIITGAPGHGCGHNIYGSTAYAAAVATKKAMEENKITGTLKVFGTPAEENYAGKAYMARAGLFNDVDACIGHHPGGINTCGLASSTAVFGVKFHYYGKSSHAAGGPENGRSALDAIELMNVGVNFLREHVIEKARIHYVIEQGGGQPNVVPDYARSWYYVRAPEMEQLRPIYNRILKIAEGAALMTETQLKTEFIDGIYNKIPNKILSQVVLCNMREVGFPQPSKEELVFASEIAKSFTVEQKIDGLKKQKLPNWEKYVDTNIMTDVIDPWNEGEVNAGSTDTGDVSWITPTAEFGTSAFVLGAPGHSWQAVACSGTSMGHKSLIYASKVASGTAIELLTNPEAIEKAKEELTKRLAGKNYVSAMPEGHNPPLDIARETWARQPKIV
jgi:aminobenzoyl-glutamate utilization protein B